MAHTAGERLPLKLLNVAVYVFFFSSSLYSVLAPGTVGKTTYLSPAPWGLYVWTLINALLLGTQVFQFTDSGFEPVIEGLGFRFIIIGVLNAIWSFLYTRGHYVVAFIFAVLLALSVTTVYYDLKSKYPPKNNLSAIFVHLPFSLWHAYVIFLLVESGAAVFGRDKALHHAGIPTKIAACVALVFFASTAVGYAFHSSKGDIAGAAVIAYELLAIYVAQPHPKIIHWFALGGFIVSLLAIVKATFYTARNPSLTSDDGERAPLIAGSD